MMRWPDLLTHPSTARSASLLLEEFVQLAIADSIEEDPMVATESNIDAQPNPAASLRGRVRVVYNWLPGNVERLLDAGCAFGETTAVFAHQCQYACGFDLMAEDIEQAKQEHPDLEFFQGNLEQTPFESESFDVVVFSDVIEHVGDEVACLNELYRILKPGGLLLLTSPHSGLFGFMDPLNSGRVLSYVARKYLAPVYGLLYRLRKGEAVPKEQLNKPLASDRDMHRHYSLADHQALLDRSSFGQNYSIEDINRYGLLLEPLVFSIEYYADTFGLPQGLQKTIKSLHSVVGVEQKLRFGPAAYNIGLKIRKAG